MSKSTHLEHLDVGDTQIQIRRVAEDQTAAEEDTDGENGLDEHFLGHINVLGAVEQGRCALQYARSYRLYASRSYRIPPPIHSYMHSQQT